MAFEPFFLSFLFSLLFDWAKVYSPNIRSIKTCALGPPRQSSGAVWESRWTSWAPALNKPTVSVDVKQHFNNNPPRLLSASVPAEAGRRFELLTACMGTNVSDSGASLHCSLVGVNKSYVMATSDLWLFIHASNLLPWLPTPLPYIKAATENGRVAACSVTTARFVTRVTKRVKSDALPERFVTPARFVTKVTRLLLPVSPWPMSNMMIQRPTVWFDRVLIAYVL